MNLLTAHIKTNIFNMSYFLLSKHCFSKVHFQKVMMFSEYKISRITMSWCYLLGFPLTICLFGPCTPDIMYRIPWLIPFQHDALSQCDYFQVHWLCDACVCHATDWNMRGALSSVVITCCDWTVLSWGIFTASLPDQLSQFKCHFG